jgi:hypothetical protein
MRNGEAMERSEELAAESSLASLRRAFLIDMAWPVGSDAICQMFGLPSASEEVLAEEIKSSMERMERFTADHVICSLVTLAAKDIARVMVEVDDEDQRIAWLATYALAVMNLLETAGRVEVTAA